MAFVQAVAAQGSAVTTVTTASITTTAGNLAVAFGTCKNATTGTSFTDSKSNTWRNGADAAGISAAVTNNPLTEKTYYGYAQLGTAGASHTFTFTTAATDTANIIVVELSGRATSLPIDASNSGNDGATNVTSHTGPSVTSVTAGCDIIAGHGEDLASGTQTYTAGSGWTTAAAAQVTNSAGWTGFVQWQLNKAAATYSDTWTTGLGSRSSAWVLAIKPAAAAAPFNPGPQPTFSSQRVRQITPTIIGASLLLTTLAPGLPPLPLQNGERPLAVDQRQAPRNFLNADTSQGTPLVLRNVQAPAFNLPFAVTPYRWTVTDTSQSVPKVLYSDAVQPASNVYLQAPEPVRSVVDTSQSAFSRAAPTPIFGTTQGTIDRPRNVSDTSLGASLALLGITPAPFQPTALTAVPGYLWQVQDTSHGFLPQPVEPSPFYGFTTQAPYRFWWQPQDASLGTPKPLYDDAVSPFANLQHTAPDAVRPVTDTSQSALALILPVPDIPPPPTIVPAGDPTKRLRWLYVGNEVFVLEPEQIKQFRSKVRKAKQHRKATPYQAQVVTDGDVTVTPISEPILRWLKSLPMVTSAAVDVEAIKRQRLRKRAAQILALLDDED